MVSSERDPPQHLVPQAPSAARRKNSRASTCVAAEGLRRSFANVCEPPALVVRNRPSPGEYRRIAIAVPLLLRAARGCRDADLALRRAPRKGQVRSASLRRLGGGFLRRSTRTGPATF